ncbi:MAG TPA: glycosyltransferase family 2 protein [Gemmataceae bacterium]|nr:glycosyltransferase family 2 protein [Gemmataceae bacterium]
MNSRSTAVVIVNFRTAGLVVDCLRTLACEVATEPEMRVVIVDNASGDDSVPRISAAIAEEGWSWAEVRPADRNGGFAYGNNTAIRYLLSLPDPPNYIWLLNPDTLVHPGASTALIDFLEANPDVGIAGGRLENPDGSPQTSAFRFPSLLGVLEDTIRIGVVSRTLERHRVPSLPRPEAHATDWVNGASMMVRCEVFETVGLMDEGYFLYFEETDFCRRVKRAGWPVWHVPTSRAIHLEGQSTGVTGTEMARKPRPQYWFDSMARYFRKNLGAGYAMVADVIFIVGFGIWRVHRRLRRKPDPDPPGLWRDYIRHARQRWFGLSN